MLVAEMPKFCCEVSEETTKNCGVTKLPIDAFNNEADCPPTLM
jgi:hypothetical protein